MDLPSIFLRMAGHITKASNFIQNPDDKGKVVDWTITDGSSEQNETPNPGFLSRSRLPDALSSEE